jgi:hypothetical protein
MNTVRLSSLSLAALLLATRAFAADDTSGDERVIRSAEGFAADHASDELRDPVTFRQTVTPADEVVTKPRGGAPRGPRIAAATLGDSYVYTAKTDLFSDFDRDGYYHHLRVTLDADSIFDPTRLYAIIYISADGKAWESLYTTDDFTVHGSSADDAYEVETDLVSGYSTGLYDVLIELYDSSTGTLVDTFGPNESPDFSVRPLEDSYRDGDPPPPDPAPVADGGGGAIDWLTLPALLAAAAWARRRRAGGVA